MEIQWNGISILFVPELLLSGMIFQNNVDIFFGMERNNMEWDGIAIFFFIATGEYFMEWKGIKQKVFIPKKCVPVVHS